MKCLILGSAAGGGFPQWNCGCTLCNRARAGDPNTRPRTQASIAFSADGEQWLLAGASPDLRQQILRSPALAPRGPRHSPLACVVLISADVDGLAGLLVLREQQSLTIFAPASILQILRDNRLFAALDPALVRQIAVAPGEPTDTGMGLRLTLLEMPGKIPLYQEDRQAAAAENAATYAAKLETAGKTVIIAPGCAEITDAVLETLSCADILFFDGTLFTDDEMIRLGLSHRTGRRMGHVSMSGPGGSLERLAGHRGRRIYFHINNSNPVLAEDSPEHRRVIEAGWQVAYDGMEISIGES